MKQYTWNFDGEAELWQNDICDGVAECVAAAREVAKEDGDDHGNTVYIGEINPFVPYVDAASLLDTIEEDACEFADEAAEDWRAYDPHVHDELDELSEALTKEVNAWLKKHGRMPSFYAVESIKAYPLLPETEVDRGCQDGHC